MPKSIKEIQLTDEMKTKLRKRVAEISGSSRVDSLISQRAAERLVAMYDKKEGLNLNILDSCMLGPTNMTTILKNSGLLMRNMTLETQAYYAVAMEEMLGLSTKMIYDKEKNQYTAVREAEGSRLYGDAFTFNEEDLKLGTWDKICAFFGVETDHAKRVSFIKESLKTQEKMVDDANKQLVAPQRDKFLEDHKDLYKVNKDFIKDLKTVEADWKNAFFGQVVEDPSTVEGYKFQAGRSISALSACIAMYKKEYGVNICEKNPSELSQEELDNMKAVAQRYMSYKEMQRESKNQALGSLPLGDFKMIEAIAYKDSFEVDYDKKVEGLESFPNEKLQNQARAMYNYPILLMKAEMTKVMEKEIYAPTAAEQKLMKEVVSVRSEIKMYENIEKGNYDKIAKDMDRAYDHPNIDKNASYSELIGLANLFNEGKKVEMEFDRLMPAKEEPEIKEMNFEDENEL